MGIIFLCSLQIRILLEIIKFHLHKSVPGVALLEMRVLFKGRSYIRKYGMCHNADKKNVDINDSLKII